jgi:hypothetical protein
LLEGTHACTWRSRTFEPFRDSAILTRDTGLRNHELYRTRVENQDCEFHDRTVVVTSCGRLCLYNEKINPSLSLAGQAVGVKEVDHGIWLVSFMDYDLGYIDLEEKTLQPLQNPFGPRV